MKAIKYSGYFLFFTGLIHNLIGLVMGWSILMEMHLDGWLASTIVDGKLSFPREAITWFLGAGTFWMIFGLMLQKAISEGFVPPKSLGWSLLIIGLVFVIIMPASGAYLFLIQGGLLIYGVAKLEQQNKQLAAAT